VTENQIKQSILSKVNSAPEIRFHTTKNPDGTMNSLYKVDKFKNQTCDNFELDQSFEDAINQIASKGFDKWEINNTQSEKGKVFAPFGLSDGQIFAEYDLIYLFNDICCFGYKNCREPWN
jgi:hypothetical protein